MNRNRSLISWGRRPEAVKKSAKGLLLIGARASCPPDLDKAERPGGQEARAPTDSGFCFAVGALLFCAILAIGCRQDMHDQSKYEPLEASTFFGDNRASRPLVEGTVARGQLREDRHFFEGKVGKDPATTFPFEVTEEVIRRGQERYAIFCAPCHGSLGDGQGMVVRRGFKRPNSFHIDRLREAPVGYYLSLIHI